MRDELQKNLYGYLIENNPDVLIELQGQRRVTAYLDEKFQDVESMLNELLSENKPPYLIQELCMQEMTAELRPSKYNYLSEILLSAFETQYEQLKEQGILLYEIINLIGHCHDLFEAFGFSDGNEDDAGFRERVISEVKRYFENK